ncbi:ArsR/SmtB family transcription factor [Niabella beijingensis]|uniref:ArsR/SmtB family transcription factor n=1 Tax=Niabella beijingensis TaxID=2872700 RepID=UPI001CBFBA12|nr:metalloregulator ArsR/SmtB family transcription factor [Niabella beijingensis]MBZ4192532.1 metalloregulator ArsR/SmtB family transcription factor [Niabella beijingensis]
MIIRRDVFQAIADPTRRQIIDLLAKQPLHVTAIAERFDVSRQAVSVHVRILAECGLLTVTQKGRERYCNAQLDKLGEVASWTAQYKQFWEGRFSALDNYLDTIKTKKSKNAKRTKPG